MTCRLLSRAPAEGPLRPHDILWLPNSEGWLVGGTDRLIADTVSTFHNPQLSLDGRTLALSTHTEKTDIIIMLDGFVE